MGRTWLNAYVLYQHQKGEDDNMHMRFIKSSDKL